MVSKFAVITFYEDGEPVRPDQGLPGNPAYPSHGLPGGGGPVDPGFGGGRPVYPSHGLPGSGPVYPSHGLPGGGFISLLPVYPFDPTDPGFGVGGGRPDNSLPGSGARPDHDLPRPGKRYIVKWLACQGLILVPDNELPGTPVRPDNSLPETPEPK